MSLVHRLIVAALMALSLVGVSAANDEVRWPLTDSDVAHYREIFAAQEKGDWKTADRHIGLLENKLLLGYVLEQRYMHPTAYRSSFRELSRWLQAYADHPNAQPIYRLAKRRQGSNISPRPPVYRKWRDEDGSPLHPDLLEDYDDPARQDVVRRIEGRLRYLTRSNRPEAALNYLNERANFNALTAAQTDRVRGWIAASFYYDGKLSQAERVAAQAYRRSSDSAVLSYWVSGLVAMRRDDPKTAFERFSAQADIPYQEDTLRAAAAYWAARTALATGNADEVMRYLRLAADFPLTFYGQLALGQLGLDPAIDWTPPQLTQADFDRLTAQSPRALRAAALAQVGLTALAEEEIKWAQGELPPTENTTLSALTHAFSLPNAQLSVALDAGAYANDGAHLRAGLFPLPGYAPNGGFTIDKAVLYGLIRQESKFMPHARSRVGAQGLMQLMPRTASYVANKDDAVPVHASRRLEDPSYNMQLGQSYVEQLLTRYNDGSGDLFEMALSYNWGPGNLARWKARSGIDDQLLFLESVPNSEARHFVETVMTNIWLYRDRLNEPAPSRDAAAAGERPIYQSVSAAE